MDDIKAIFKSKSHEKREDDEEFFNEDSSDEEIKEDKGGIELQLEQNDDEYDKFMEGVSLKSRR